MSNIRLNTKNRFNELMNKLTNYSIGQVLYAVLRTAKKNRGIDADISWILEIDDMDMYTYIEKTKTFEQEV